MEEANKILARVRQDYPKLRFVVGKRFAFRSPRTIFVVDPDGSETWGLELLHELGHARLEHRNYQTDVERLKMEREAWEEARGLADEYGVCYNEEFVEAELDSYREWLHQRSKCKQCGLTRYQTVDGEYHCPQCEIGVGRYGI